MTLFVLHLINLYSMSMPSSVMQRILMLLRKLSDLPIHLKVNRHYIRLNLPDPMRYDRRATNVQADVSNRFRYVIARLKMNATTSSPMATLSLEIKRKGSKGSRRYACALVKTRLLINPN